MTSGGRRWTIVSMTVLSIAVLAGCGRQGVADAPRIEEKTFPLRPASADVRVGFLSGQLKDLKVVQRVNAETGEVVLAPQLRGALRLKNTSTDQAARLLGARVEYLDADGKPIRLAEGRGETSVRFSAYSADRLDPGMETSQDIDLPFPAKALDGRALADMRLDVTYIATPYRKESVTLPLAVDQGS